LEALSDDSIRSLRQKVRKLKNLIKLEKKSKQKNMNSNVSFNYRREEFNRGIQNDYVFEQSERS